MSCKACDETKDIAYYRWGKANVGLIGCDEHVGEIMFILQNTQMANPEMLEIAKEHRQKPIYRIKSDT